MIPLPPIKLRFISHESDEKFLTDARTLLGYLKYANYKPDATIIDIGSGYGRLAYALEENKHTGDYFGIDTLKPHIDFCSEAFKPVTNFKFMHLNIYNGRYNPEGKAVTEKFKFPLGDSSADMICLFSVFTHTYEMDIDIYAKEIYRMLKPNGRCVCTLFLFNKERKQYISTSSIPMANVLNDYTIYNDKTDPLAAICYRDDVIIEKFKDLGFDVALLPGNWCRDPKVTTKDIYQDMFVLTKPAPVEIKKKEEPKLVELIAHETIGIQPVCPIVVEDKKEITLQPAPTLKTVKNPEVIICEKCGHKRLIQAALEQYVPKDGNILTRFVSKSFGLDRQIVTKAYCGECKDEITLSEVKVTSPTRDDLWRDLNGL